MGLFGRKKELGAKEKSTILQAARILLKEGTVTPRSIRESVSQGLKDLNYSDYKVDGENELSVTRELVSWGGVAQNVTGLELWGETAELPDVLKAIDQTIDCLK